MMQLIYNAKTGETTFKEVKGEEIVMVEPIEVDPTKEELMIQIAELTAKVEALV